MTGFKNGIRAFGHNTALIINTLLLALVYFLGVGITSIIARIFGKHFLDMRLSKNPTYWYDLNLRKKPIKEHYRQF